VYGYAMQPVVHLSGLPAAAQANGTFNLDSTADLRLFSTPSGTKFTYQGVEKCCQWVYGYPLTTGVYIALQADNLFIFFSVDGYRFQYVSDSIGDFMCSRATSSGSGTTGSQGTAVAIGEQYPFYGTRDNSPRSFEWTLSLL
jgi:hypothetical protein